MANLKYVEPGTYVSTESSKKTNLVDNTVKMYPLLIGRIPEYVPTTITMVRTGDFDEFPSGYSSKNVKQINWIKSPYFSSKIYSPGDRYREFILKDDKYGIKWYDYSRKIERREYPEYKLLIKKPDDWDDVTDDNVDKYFSISFSDPNNSGMITKADKLSITEGSGTSLTRPDFEPNKYYTSNTENEYNVLEVKYEGCDFESETTEEKEVSSIEVKNPNSPTGFTTVTAENLLTKYVEFYYPTESNVDNIDVPALGSAYKVNMLLEPDKDSDYYKIQEFSEVEDVVAFYGEDTIAVDYDENGVGFNPIPTAAAILKESKIDRFFTLGVSVPQEVIDPDLGYLTMVEDKEHNRFCYLRNEETGDILVDSEEHNNYKRAYAPIYKKLADCKYYDIYGNIVLLKECNYGFGAPSDSVKLRVDVDNTYAEYYKKALETACIDVEAERLYRIIPLDQGKKIAQVVKNHVSEFSSDEERMECSGMVSVPYSTSNYISYDNYLGDVVDTASSLDSSRMVFSFGGADRTLSDGTVVHLSTQYLFSYIAGIENVKTNGTGLTNITIPMETLTNLDIPTMRRTAKNDVASAGVLVFEQRPATSAIKVRHALTTKISDSYGKEMSVQYNIDYSRKYLRLICSPYIGQRNVNSETLELIEETITEGLDLLVEEGKLISGTISNIGVSEDSADTIVVVLKVAVSFPLNYIYITLVLDN